MIIQSLNRALSDRRKHFKAQSCSLASDKETKYKHARREAKSRGCSS